MQLSLDTLILLRQAALAQIAAIEQAALEGYGWTPRRPRVLDICDKIEDNRAGFAGASLGGCDGEQVTRAVPIN